LKVRIILLLLVSVASSIASDVVIGRFSSGDLSGWHEQTFSGKARTNYDLVRENGKSVVQARSRRSASGLLKKIDLDPKKYPVLRWSWKVQHTLKGEDVTRKSGDDFAARVYVVFPRTFLWRSRAINYVWAARLPKDAAIHSSYTANAMIVAAESGEERAGTWVAEERNIYMDYRRLFHEEPPEIGAVAVMTDTDDTGDEARAWFGDISLSGR